MHVLEGEHLGEALLSVPCVPAGWYEGLRLLEGPEHPVPPGDVAIVASMSTALVVDRVLLGPL